MGTKEAGHQKLKIGMTVEVNPRSDRSNTKLVQGVVSKILTKARGHPHGILVSLESGETGRVKRVIDTAGAPQNESATPQVDGVTPADQLKGLIDRGGNHKVEFKSEALWSTHFTNEDIKNHKPQSKDLHAYGQATFKIIIAKTLAGFLNSDGGTLIIGVRENKTGGTDQIVGIESEFKSLKDPCKDGYRRMIVDLIKDYFPSNIFNRLDNYIHITFEEMNDLTVCAITVSRFDKRVFIKLKNVDHFYVRTDASIRGLACEEVVDYCQTRFSY